MLYYLYRLLNFLWIIAFLGIIGLSTEVRNILVNLGNLVVYLIILVVGLFWVYLEVKIDRRFKK